MTLARLKAKEWLELALGTMALFMLAFGAPRAAFGQAAQVDNLSWRPNATTTRWQGSFQPVTSTSLVICGATAASNVNSAPIVQFQNCATFVFACDVLRTVGATDGCPTPGNYSQERFLPRSTVAGAPAACPPPPPAETRPQVCPAGTLGQWTQTAQYTQVPAPECWRLNAWLPAEPPPGACPPIPPLAITSFNAAPSTEVPANGGVVTLTWTANATEGCRLNDAPVPNNGTQTVTLTSASPEFSDYTLVCQQEGETKTLGVRIRVEQPPICYPLSEVPPEDWSIVSDWKLVWYAGELFPGGYAAHWRCRKPDNTLTDHCIASRFGELDEDAEEVKHGDKARKDQKWRSTSWRPLTSEEQAACDAMRAP